MELETGNYLRIKGRKKDNKDHDQKEKEGDDDEQKNIEGEI